MTAAPDPTIAASVHPMPPTYGIAEAALTASHPNSNASHRDRGAGHNRRPSENTANATPSDARNHNASSNASPNGSPTSVIAASTATIGIPIASANPMPRDAHGRSVAVSATRSAARGATSTTIPASRSVDTANASHAAHAPKTSTGVQRRNAAP